jgi:polar amino acid transport system substrate-binding protein
MRIVRESARLACLFAVAGLLVFAGCTKIPTPEQGGAADSALKQVLQRGTLRVGDCLTFAPFGFYNKDGQPDGYDVDLAKELANGRQARSREYDERQPHSEPANQQG